METITWTTEYYDDVGETWVEIQDDILTELVCRHYQGFSSNSPLSRVASPGKYMFTLRNSVKSSGGVAGYYSPGHASVRQGFKHGAPIRVRYRYGEIWDKIVGEVSDFDAITDGDGDMNDRFVAAHDGVVGLELTFDDNTPAYGTMNLDAVNQTSGVLSFWFDYNDMTMDAGGYSWIFWACHGGEAPVNSWQSILYNDAGIYKINIRWLKDDDAAGASAYVAIPVGYNHYLFTWQRSTGVGNNDGWMRLRINGVPWLSEAGIDNDTKDWDYLRIGVVQAGSLGASVGGSFYMDTIKIASIESQTRQKWYGWMQSIKPDADQKGSQTTRIIAYDILFDFTKQNIKGLGVQTNQRGDQALVTLLTIMPDGKQPQSTSFDVGISTYPLVFHTERDERTKVMGIAQRIVLTEFGKIYDNGGDLVFENRHHSISETTVQYDFDDDAPGVKITGVQFDEKNIKTRVLAKTYPAEFDDANVVMTTLQSPISVGAGVTTSPFTMRFRDPTTGSRVSVDTNGIVTPVESTDYVGKANENGTGTDLSANMVVTIVSESGNSAKVTVENTGDTLLYTGGDAGVFQLRGKGIYLFDPISSESISSDAIMNQYGDRELEYDLPYESNPLVGDGYSSYLLETYENARLEIAGTVEYKPQVNAGLAAAFMDIIIGKRITCMRSQVAMDLDFFVIKLDVQIKGRIIVVSQKVETAESGAYCKLNDNTYGVLNADVCRLAF